MPSSVRAKANKSNVSNQLQSYSHEKNRASTSQGKHFTYQPYEQTLNLPPRVYPQNLRTGGNFATLSGEPSFLG